MPTETTTPDLRPMLDRALDQVGALIEQVRPDQRTAPTPCTDYDVAGVVGHLQGAARRVATVMSGQHFASTPPTTLGDDWAADWAAERDELGRVLADDGVLTREVTVPWGQVSGGSALGMYVGEFVVHAWDLAAAIDATDRLDPTLAQAALPAYERALPPEPRGGEIPFAPVVDIDDTAGPYERVVAWTGRDPSWTPTT